MTTARLACIIAATLLVSFARGEQGAGATCEEDDFPSSLVEARAAFLRDGYTVLRGFLSSEETDVIEAQYDKLTHPTAEQMAAFEKDYGDQSPGVGVDPKDFTLINVNNPGRYVKSHNFTDNEFVRKAEVVARTFMGDSATMDYEQLLEKLPRRDAAAFPWHQDMQYWPKHYPQGTSTATVTFSLALSDSDEENGCLRVLPGSGAAKTIASGGNSADSTLKERAMKLELTTDQLAAAKLLRVKRGDVTVHDEWIVHGSGGNPSNRVRKTYVLAYRDAALIDYERSIGFSHSYNDDPSVTARIRAGEL
jgi:ectoine hydroxylase-related dioxygenase (phytanoyl-CoA dioxygenase family)